MIIKKFKTIDEMRKNKTGIKDTAYITVSETNFLINKITAGYEVSSQAGKTNFIPTNTLTVGQAVEFLR